MADLERGLIRPCLTIALLPSPVLHGRHADIGGSTTKDGTE